MSNREKLATTLGILMAGLLEAEEAAAESQRRPGRTPHKASGVYPIGDALYASDMPMESNPTAADAVGGVDEYIDGRALYADAIDPL